MSDYENEYRLLKLLKGYIDYDKKKLNARILYELNKYEKLYFLSRLLDNADKGILNEQNLSDIKFLHTNNHISDNAYNYFMKLKNITEQGYKQIEVATDTGFKYPTVQEQFEKHIKTLWD